MSPLTHLHGLHLVTPRRAGPCPQGPLTSLRGFPVQSVIQWNGVCVRLASRTSRHTSEVPLCTFIGGQPTCHHGTIFHHEDVHSVFIRSRTGGLLVASEFGNDRRGCRTTCAGCVWTYVFNPPRERWLKFASRPSRLPKWLTMLRPHGAVDERPARTPRPRCHRRWDCPRAGRCAVVAPCHRRWQPPDGGDAGR